MALTLADVSKLDEDEARDTLERIRWPEGPVCAHCGAMDRITRFEGRKHRAGVYKCNDCGEQFTANLGKAKSKGGDFEVIYRPIPALTLDLTAAYTDARLTNSSCAGALVYNIASAACVAPGATGVPVSRPIASSGDALLGAPWAFTLARYFGSHPSSDA